MALFNFIGPAYQSRGIIAESERWINMFIEKIESGLGSSRDTKFTAYPTPGKQLMVTLDDAPVAALSAAASAAPPTAPALWKYFAIGGQTLYWIEADFVGPAYLGTAHTIGTVAKQVLPGTGGQLAPGQILVLGLNQIFVVVAGQAWLAGYGAPITGSALSGGGSGYSAGDTGIVLTGLAPAAYIITSVGGAGDVTGYTITGTGSGYAVGTNIPTKSEGAQPGAGIGFSIDISTVGADAWVLVDQTVFMNEIAPSTSFIRSCTFLDGFVIISFAPNSQDPARRQFFISGANDALSWNALDFGLKEGAPDSMMMVYAAYQILILFGLRTTEFWQDSGNVLFPFQRISGGGVIEYGLVSPYCVSKAGNATMWLGQDSRGSRVAWMLEGQTPVRISNHAVENTWEQLDIGSAVSMSYTENGHDFWCISFPAADRTFSYDKRLGPEWGWHERAFWDGAAFHADLARFHCIYDTGPHVVGDYSNGNLYIQSMNILQDNCLNIRRIRVTPHVNNERKRILYHRFRLDCLTGVVPASGAGSAPVMSLRISNDGGRSYGPYLTIPVGTIGEYTKLVQWYHLGYSENRVFEWSCDEPIDLVLVDGYIEFHGAKT